MNISRILEYLDQIEKLEGIKLDIKRYDGKAIPNSFFKILRIQDPNLDGYCDVSGIEFLYKTKTIFKISFIKSPIYVSGKFNFGEFKRVVDNTIKNLYKKIEKLRLA